MKNKNNNSVGFRENFVSLPQTIEVVLEGIPQAKNPSKETSAVTRTTAEGKTDFVKFETGIIGDDHKGDGTAKYCAIDIQRTTKKKETIKT